LNLCESVKDFDDLNGKLINAMRPANPQACGQRWQPFVWNSRADEHPG